MKSNLSFANRRRGISIIEVLTSMAVATIGVFGVMVLIPFAVNQSQRGLDNDVSNVVGQNALEELITRGIFQTENTGAPSGESLTAIVFPSPTDSDRCSTTPISGGLGVYSLDDLGLAEDVGTSGLVHLDPIGVAYPGGPVVSFSLPPGAPAGSEEILIPSVTLRNGNPAAIFSRYSAAEASQFCRNRDDLFVSEERFDSASGAYVETDDVGQPQQYFDLAGGEAFKRSSESRISWSVLLNPTKNSSLVKELAADPATPPSHFKAYVLTYKQRSFGGSAFVSTISNGAGKYGFEGTLPLRELGLNTAIDEDATIRKGSWVMLINLIPLPNFALDPQLPVSVNGNRADEPGYDKQVMFARVTRVDRINNVVTIDGGAFEIFPGADQRSDTYMVYIPEVVNVFERTIKIER
jgi:hypothetical protein